MGRGVHCTAPERQIIKKLSDEGKSMTEIAELMNCSKKKVFSAVHYIDKKENRGRKRATTKRFDDILARISNAVSLRAIENCEFVLCLGNSKAPSACSWKTVASASCSDRFGRGVHENGYHSAKSGNYRCL